MKLAELQDLSVTDLSSRIETLEPELPVTKVIGFMRERRLTESFVEERERTGIVTLRDLLKVQNITTTKLSTIMSYVPRLNSNNNISDAASLMFEHRIRSLPIYENGKAVGKIESFPIISKLVESGPSVKLNRLMTPDPITIDENDEIGKARRVMIRRKIDQLPVTREGKVVSCVRSDAIVYNTLPSIDRDMRGDWWLGRNEVPVRNYADPDYVQNNIRDSIKQVFENMKKAEKTYSVILMFDEIQGIITHRDFMKLFTSIRSSADVPMYMVGLLDAPFEAEAARDKFTRIVNLIRKGHPNTVEARAIIKSGETKSARRKYRVQIFIMTPKEKYNYTVFGFELPNVFDEIEKWAKGLVARYERRPRRVRADPGAISPERPDLWAN